MKHWLQKWSYEPPRAAAAAAVGVRSATLEAVRPATHERMELETLIVRTEAPALNLTFNLYLVSRLRFLGENMSKKSDGYRNGRAQRPGLRAQHPGLRAQRATLGAISDAHMAC